MTYTHYPSATPAAESQVALLSKEMEKVYQRGDRMMKIFLLVHFGIALLLAPANSTWLLTFSVGAITVAMFFISAHLLPGTFFTRCMSGVSLQIFVALHIYQMHGLAEMHFFFFTGFTMMIVYQDWKSMWPGTIFIIAQHLLFAILHNDGKDLYFFEERYIEFQKLFFHFGIAIGQVCICGYWAYLLFEQTVREVNNIRLMSEKGQELERANVELETSLEESRSIEEELRQQADHMKDIQEELERKQYEIAHHNSELESKITERTRDVQESLEVARKQEFELKQISEKLQAKQKEMEMQQFIDTNVSKFDDVMRLNYNKSIEEFGDVIALHLAKIVGVMRVVVFIYDADEELLKAIGGYACTPRTLVKREFMLGEGLLGQAGKSQEIIMLENLPAHSSRVPSSLTEIENKHIALIPLVYNEQLQGVIELTGLHAFGELNMAFIRRVSRNIAAMFLNIVTSLNTQRLLAESQDVMAQISAQEEEMRQHLEELEATQEEMKRRERLHLKEIEMLNRQHEQDVEQLQQKNVLLNEIQEEISQNVEEMKAIQDSLAEQIAQAEMKSVTLNAVLDIVSEAIVTFDASRTIRFVNVPLMQLFGYSEKELIGTHIRGLFASQHYTLLERHLSIHTSEERRVITNGEKPDAQAKDGSIFPVDIAIHQVMVNDKPLFTATLHRQYQQSPLTADVDATGVAALRS